LRNLLTKQKEVNCRKENLTMKKLFTVAMGMLFMVYALNLSAQVNQDWKWQHQSPQGNTLRQVIKINSSTWYAFGYAGTFLKTTNAGANWTLRTDAGKRFQVTGQFANVYDAKFFDANTGIICGSSGNLARTTNGGTTWDTSTVVPTSATLYHIYFINNLTGYISGTSTAKLLKTTDGGLTWVILITPAYTTGYDVYASDTNNILVSSASGGVYKSTTGAYGTFTLITTGATGTMYKIQFLDANTGIVAGSLGSCRLTTNGGTTWSVASSGLPSGDTYYDIDIMASSSAPTPFLETFASTTFPPTGWSISNSIYWYRYDTSAYSIGTGSCDYNFYSSSGGTQDTLTSPSFNPTATGDTLKFDIAYKPYPGSNDKIQILTSTDAGATFNQLVLMDSSTMGTVLSGTGHFFPLGNQFAPRKFVLPAGTSKLKFVAISDFGNDAYIDNIKVQYGGTSSGTTVFLTGNSLNLYKSTNLGTSWDTLQIAPNINSGPWVSTMYASVIGNSTGDSTVSVGAYGIMDARISAGYRPTFTTMLKGGTIYDVWASSITGTVITVGAPTVAGSSFDQILKSTNGGTTWSVLTLTGSTATFNSIGMVDATTGWIVGSNSAVYKTTNGGTSFDSVAISNMAAGLNLSKVQFVNATTGFIFSKTYVSTDTTTIFKTTNGGTTWAKLRLTGAVGVSNQIYGASMLDANTGWIINYTPVPFKTTDGGNTWTAQTLIDGYAGLLYEIKMFDANSGFVCGGSGHLYKTTNGGILWDTVSVPSRNYSFYTLKFASPQIGIVLGASGVTYSTINGGGAWTLTNTSGSTIYGSWMDNAYKLFCVGSLGYIHKNIVTINGIINGNENNQLPTKYELSQNYPNPFNPTTTISFALPKPGNVSLKVYDMVGREVMTLFNNQQLNAGVTRYLFNGSNLASGIYFYSLVVDNNLISTKKMVLVK
jgi:photosystem II stability/assembly factor-like uncharacterized protein